MKIVGWIQIISSIVIATILFFVKMEFILASIIIAVEGVVMGMTILYASRVPEVEKTADHASFNVKALGKRTVDLQVEIVNLKSEINKLNKIIESLQNE